MRNEAKCQTEALLTPIRTYDSDDDEPVTRCGYFTVALLALFTVCFIAFYALTRDIDLSHHRHLDYQHMEVTTKMCKFLLTERRQSFGKYVFTTVDYTAVPLDTSKNWNSMADITIRLKTLLTDENEGKGNRAIILSGHKASLILVLDQEWNGSPSPSFIDDIHKEIDGEQTTRVISTLTANRTGTTKFWLIQELKLEGDFIKLRCTTENYEGHVNQLRKWDSAPFLVGPVTDKMKWRISLLGLRDEDHKLFGRYAACRYKQQNF